jgi:putative ABC transport system ATP-binding protein
MISARKIIETVDITKVYGMGDVSVAALKGINISIEAGEFVAIMGSSGSGKSTLMHILGCLSRPTDGQYFLDGEDVSQLDKVQLAGVRNRKIGFIFQAYNLLARTSALRNVTLPLLYDHANPRTPEEADEKAAKLLDMVGLSDRIHHQPHELSGGQQQRVAIARALVNEPAILLADEPTGALDSRTGVEIMELFQSLYRDHGQTVILVTHDSYVARHTNRIIKLSDGSIISDEVNTHPIEAGTPRTEEVL